MSKKNVIGLAKSTTKKPTNTPIVKTTKVDDGLIDFSEDRDVKAKRKVEELLKNIDLAPKLKEEIIEIDTEHKEGIDWLQEQLALLSETNEKLRQELGECKEDYRKIFQENQELKAGNPVANDIVTLNVRKLFIEIQDNFFKMGKNAYGQPNLIIAPVDFMERLIIFFPFLKELKKY